MPARQFFSPIKCLLMTTVSALALFLLLGLPASSYKSSDVMTDVEGDSPDYLVSGRVTHLVNGEQKPVADVSVLLWEKEGNLSMECKSSPKGEFKFEHKACGKLCLQVAPAPSTKLATAMVENVPGEEPRKMVVVLKSGFIVRGRIVHGKKGLKGLIVKVKPVDPPTNAVKVHGGGVGETDKDGAFEFALTSGAKRITILNEQYPELTSHISKILTVDDDMQLSPIELPKAEKSEKSEKAEKTEKSEKSEKPEKQVKQPKPPKKVDLGKEDEE
jgi:hypothetical protein